MKKKVKVAVIATGRRSENVVDHLLKDSCRKVEIAAVYDPDKELVAEVLQKWEYPDAKICGSTEEAINFPGVEWVMVFSPNAFHKEAVIAAFKAGKHVFSEKPLATAIADCRSNEYAISMRKR